MVAGCSGRDGQFPCAPLELQSRCVCGPAVPGVGTTLTSPSLKKCLSNEPLGPLHPSPHPEPFFRVTAKNEERGQEGVSCLSKVYVTLPDTTITLLKGRRTLVSPFL